MKRYSPLLTIALLVAPACDSVEYDDEGLSTDEAYDDLILAGAAASESLCSCYGGEDDCNRAQEVRDRSCELEVFESWADAANFLRCRSERFSGMQACAEGCPPFESYLECVVPHDDAYRRCTGSLPPDVQRQLAMCEVASPQCASNQDCGEDQRCEDGVCEPEERSGPVYRFVLLEPAAAEATGPYPGPDVDAVGLVKANGTEWFATAVEAADVPMDTLASNLNALVGPPDAACEDLSAMTALGAAGNYVVVSFGTAGEDVIIENGDQLHVYALGQDTCGDFEDDDDLNIGVLRSPEQLENVEPLCTNCQQVRVEGL